MTTQALAAAQAICDMFCINDVKHVPTIAAIISAHFPAPSGSALDALKAEYDRLEAACNEDEGRERGSHWVSYYRQFQSFLAGQIDRIEHSHEAALAGALEHVLLAHRELREIGDFPSAGRYGTAMSDVEVSESEANAALARYREATGK